MFPLYHGIFGALLSLILLLFFPQIGWIGASVIFASSILIDVDHYMYYVFKKKDFSLPRAYRYFVNLRNIYLRGSLNRYQHPVMLFHGIEFCILLILLSYIHIFFFWILIGFLIHLALDFLDSFLSNNSPLFKLSQIYVLVTNKNKKRML